MSGYQKKKILITVKTYPLPSKKSIEASCTAGITEDGNWIRLFPLPFRLLEQSKRFKKYQWIEASVIKARDPRPESYKIDIDSIKPIGTPITTENNWEFRKKYVLPLAQNSLCYLQNSYEQTGTTLGIFKPRCINELIIEPEEASNWTEDELSALNQQSFFENKLITPLEKIPYKFKYGFFCKESSCPGHNLSITDWEAGQAYRNYKRLYKQNWESKFREKFEYDMQFINDTYLYVGTIRAYPNHWIIIGLFYPKLENSIT